MLWKQIKIITSNYFGMKSDKLYMHDTKEALDLLMEQSIVLGADSNLSTTLTHSLTIYQHFPVRRLQNTWQHVPAEKEMLGVQVNHVTTGMCDCQSNKQWGLLTVWWIWRPRCDPVGPWPDLHRSHSSRPWRPPGPRTSYSGVSGTCPPYGPYPAPPTGHLWGRRQKSRSGIVTKATWQQSVHSVTSKVMTSKKVRSNSTEIWDNEC